MSSTPPPYPNRRSIRGRFLRRITKPDATLAEWWSGYAAIAWGACLANPFADPFASLPVYRSMASLAPAWVWGLVVLVGGTFQLRSLSVGVYVWRRAAAFGGFVTWLFVGLCMWASAPTSTGPPVYVMLAALQAAIYWRLKIEAIKATQRATAITPVDE